MSAGDYLAKDIAAPAEGGRVVFIGAARGTQTDKIALLVSRDE